MKVDEIKTKLSEEVDACSWNALAPHAKAGRLLWVHPPLKLLEAALAVATDQKEAVQAWLSVGLIEMIGEEARSELKERALSFVIVQPFVLGAFSPEREEYSEPERLTEK